MLCAKIKNTRIRKSPNKKWLSHEEASLIKYMKNNRDFERPTAQIYYRKYLKEHPVGVEWTVIRAKVRNMRLAYAKAKAWENSVGGDCLPDGETIRDVLLRKCHFFDDLDEIFNCNYIDSIENFESISCKPEQKFQSELLNQTEFESPFDDIDESSAAAKSSQLCDSERFSDNDSSATIEIDRQETLTEDIVKIQTEFILVKRQKLIQEKQLKEQELALTREKLYLEREKEKNKLEIKEKELKSQEKLKILELEMKERIAMRELEMKERIALKELEIKLL